MRTSEGHVRCFGGRQRGQRSLDTSRGQKVTRMEDRGDQLEAAGEDIMSLSETLQGDGGETVGQLDMDHGENTDERSAGVNTFM